MVYYPDGQLKRSIDPEDNITSYVYDDANRQTAVFTQSVLSPFQKSVPI